MSLNKEELDHFAALAYRVVQLIDATTIAITDVNPQAINITRDQLAVLVNRYYKETPNVGKPTALAES